MQVDLEGFDLLPEPPEDVVSDDGAEPPPEGDGAHEPGSLDEHALVADPGEGVLEDTVADGVGHGDHERFSPPDAPQIDLDMDVLPVPAGKKLQFKRRTPEHISHAREIRLKRLATEKAARSEEQRAETEGTLNTVVALCPGVAKLVGTTPRHVGRIPTAKMQPHHFRILRFATHLPLKSAVQVGVRLCRLICLACHLIQCRQNSGIDRIMSASGVALTEGSPEKPRCVHVVYCHLWDEVDVKARRRRTGKYRASRMTTATKALVQRGVFHLGMAESNPDRIGFHDEMVMVPAVTVEGSSASALWPGLLPGMPASVRFDSMDALEKLMSMCSTYTFQPMCDKASGNVLLLTYMGCMWQDTMLEKFGGRLRFWPDTCAIHTQHRGKLALKCLRHHVSRHFSMAKLGRQSDIQQRVLHLLEIGVPGRLTRKVGRPPTGADAPCTMHDFLDTLFDFSAEHHKRKKNKESQFLTDLRFLAEMMNGDLRAREWHHHCWDDASGRACCSNTDQCHTKMVVAIANVIVGRSEGVPAENTWTHTLSNFKATMVRFVCSQRSGIEVFTRPSKQKGIPSETTEGLHNYFQAVRLSREERVFEYLAEPQNIFELSVLTVVLEVYDGRLLYPLFGGFVPPANSDDFGKLGLLLRKASSLIAECLNGFLHLLEVWLVGGPRRRPWCVNDVVGAPSQSPAFKSWARGQILRSHTELHSWR